MAHVHQNHRVEKYYPMIDNLTPRPETGQAILITLATGTTRSASGSALTLLICIELDVVKTHSSRSSRYLTATSPLSNTPALTFLPSSRIELLLFIRLPDYSKPLPCLGLLQQRPVACTTKWMQTPGEKCCRVYCHQTRPTVCSC